MVLGAYNDIEPTRAALRANASDLACVLIEPMMGSAGCLQADAAFLAMLREETRAAGIVLILDEVMTSRFGRGGAQSLLGWTADLTTLGKWIGGGMSFGAFGGRADLLAHFDPTRPGAMPHAGTFNNNVLTMSAGIAALSEVFTPDIAEALHRRGDALRSRINDVFNRHGVAVQMTGQGSLMSLHATAAPIRRPADFALGDDRVKELLFFDLLARGYYMARRGFIALTLVAGEAETDGFVAALDDILTQRRSVLPRA
jgi:glutamate-1-semialdehyde 2,1-aminomutase